MDNQALIDFLSRIGLLLELKGESPFKVKSFNNAAFLISNLEEDLYELCEQGRLTKIKGIGKSISENIYQFMDRGGSDLLDQLELEVPEGLVEMTNIRGLGPAKIKKLHDALEITSIVDLEYACHENRLLELKGFGEITQAKLLKEIEFYKRHSSLFHIHFAYTALEEMLEQLKGNENIVHASVVGEARRFMEVVGKGAIAIGAKDVSLAIKSIEQMECITDIIESSPEYLKVVYRFAMPIEIFLSPKENFPVLKFVHTGAAKHVDAIMAMAKDKGVSEENLNGGESIYKAIGLPHIPPELREGNGEIEAESIPDLITEKDLKGLLHVHTQYSDGHNTLLEMAEAAKAMGYGYLGISDHSRTASYAGGLSIDALKAQGEEIKKLNKELKGFQLLYGVESDILKDGSLDYPDEVLSKLDFVIASVHSSFQLDEKTMTKRIISAIKNPHVRILGHPTGRLLLGRAPYEVDMDQVISACKEYNVILELNSNPHRLDVDWRLLKQVKSQGVKVAINPDAHRIEGLNDVRYGIGIARKGWLTSEDVINTLNADALLDLWR